MKVRIGFGLGTGTTTHSERFVELVDALEALDFDSLWLSERLTYDCPDPLVALALAAGRTTKLKLGTSVLVLPGRNPVVLAKELATLDRLSNGRLLPALGLGAPEGAEHRAFGVQREERAARFDEAVEVLRRLWTEDTVDHEGTYFTLHGVSVRPRPVQRPIELWLGGHTPSELRRCARLGDGWLPAFCTPDEVRAGRKEIERGAETHGRTIDPEHFGALVPYARDGVPDRVAEAIRRRRPSVDPATIIPVGLKALRVTVEAMVDAGASKFVAVPVDEPDGWPDHLAELAESVVRPLEN